MATNALSGGIGPAFAKGICQTNQTISWGNFPEELKHSIFGFLKPDELARCSQVCRSWNREVNEDPVWNEQCRRVNLVALPATQQTPKQVFAHWIQFQYLGTVDDVPSLPPTIQDILKSPCKFWPDKTVGETHMCILIPSRLALRTHKGYSAIRNNLGNFDKAIKSQKGLGYRSIWEPILTILGKKGVDKSYWVLMTRDVIPGSRDMSYDRQKQLVESAAGYRMPDALEAVVCILSEHHSSKQQRLFGDNPGTFTNCQEEIIGCPLAVGDFTDQGLQVTISSYAAPSIGAAALSVLGP